MTEEEKTITFPPIKKRDTPLVRIANFILRLTSKGYRKRLGAIMTSGEACLAAGVVVDKVKVVYLSDLLGEDPDIDPDEIRDGLAGFDGPGDPYAPTDTAESVQTDRED
jgi:hypothetical protein